MKLRPLWRRFRSDVLSWGRFITATVVVTGLVVTAGYGVYAEVWPAIVKHSYFRLRTVKVVCDSAVAVPAKLAARAGLYDDTTLWQIDVARARRALASVAWVREVHVHRMFPDQVSLEVYRRDPVAATLVDGKPYLVDADGVVYREDGIVPYVDLPYLTGWDRAQVQAERAARLRRQLDLLAAFQANGIAVSELRCDTDGSFWLYPDAERVSVRLGAEPHAMTVAVRLGRILAALGGESDGVREIDLSFHDRAVVRATRGGATTIMSTVAGGRGADGRGALDG